MAQTDRDKWDARYGGDDCSQPAQPTALLADWIDRLPRGQALDLACGRGRNALLLAAAGFAVDAVDISPRGLEQGRRAAEMLGLNINWLEHDLDRPLALTGPWQLIVAVRYVNLPLLIDLKQHLAPGGFLLCEQHCISDRPVAGPSDPAFRVELGALLTVADGLNIHLAREILVEEEGGHLVALAQLVAERRAGA